MLPCVSIMVCPLKEVGTSARRLTEGVLEVEGPTSADAGVASCLLFDTETEFRRLRDIFLDGLVFEDGMKRLGGIELPRKGYVGRSRKTGAIGARESRAVRSATEEILGACRTILNDSKTAKFSSNNHQTPRP